jgi:hypothetical protein
MRLVMGCPAGATFSRVSFSADSADSAYSADSADSADSLDSVVSASGRLARRGKTPGDSFGIPREKRKRTPKTTGVSRPASEGLSARDNDNKPGGQK